MRRYQLLHKDTYMTFLLLFLLEIVVLFFLSQQVTILLSHALLRMTKSERTTIYLFSLFFLPGTIIHELSHLLVAGILFVPVGNIEFMPVVRHDSVKLGSVSIGRSDPIRRAIIGFAPFFVGLSLMVGLVFYLLHYASFSWLMKSAIGVFSAFQIGNTMFSSKKDMEGSLETLGALIVIGIVFYALGLRIPQEVINYLLSEQVVNLITTASLYMLVPLVLDLLLVGFFKSVLRY